MDTQPIVGKLLQDVPPKTFEGQRWPMEFLRFTHGPTGAGLIAHVNVFFKPNFVQEVWFPVDPEYPLVHGLYGLSDDTVTSLLRQAQEAYGKARPDVEAW